MVLLSFLLQKTVTLLIAIEKIIPIIQFILRNKIIHGERNISSLICNGL